MARAEPAESPAPLSNAKKAALAINPHVAEVLNGVCKQLSAAKGLSCGAEITFDSVLPSLVKLQYSAGAGCFGRTAEPPGDQLPERPRRQKIWYNGKTLAIFDPAHMAYASVVAPDTIDAMIAQVARDKNLSISLKGFDTGNPCVASKEVLYSKYIGLNDAAGVYRNQVAFIQEDMGSGECG